MQFVRSPGGPLVWLCTFAIYLLTPALAAGSTLSVSSASDHGPGTLRQAFLDAESNPGFHRIVFAPGLGEVVLDGPLPEIRGSAIHVVGPGASSLTVRMNADEDEFARYSSSPAVRIDPAGSLRLSDLTFATAHRAGIANEGRLLLDGVLLRTVAPHDRGGIVLAPAIRNGAGASVSIERSTLLAWANSAIVNEGAASLNQSAVLRTTHFSGIRNTGRLTVRSSTVGWNRGQEAGGILNDGRGRVLVVNSTIGHNTAMHEGGGGLANVSPQATVAVRNSTIARNFGSVATNLNAVGPVRLQSTILAHNLHPSDPAPVCSGEGVDSDGYNLAEDRSCRLHGPADQAGLDPKLGQLTDNGGHLPTMAPAPWSPAIDSGTSGGLLSDQRGRERTVDLPCVPNAEPAGDGTDIGALEYDGVGTDPDESQLELLSLKRRRSGDLALCVLAPSAGRVEVARTRRVARAARQVKRPRAVAVRIAPKGKAKRKLARVKRGGATSVRVRARVQFQPRSGGRSSRFERRVKLVRRR